MVVRILLLIIKEVLSKNPKLNLQLLHNASGSTKPEYPETPDLNQSLTNPTRSLIITKRDQRPKQIPKHHRTGSHISEKGKRMFSQHLSNAVVECIP
jgi:hypothetical protein